MNFKNKLIDYCDNITDGEHNTIYDDINGNYYLLSNKNIVNSKIVIDNEDRKISEETFLKINKRTKLDIMDILISTVGTLGKLAIVKEKPNYDFQRSVGIIKCNKEKLNNEYLYYYLSQNYIQNLLINNSKGAVQKCIFINDLKNLKVNFPNIDIQKKRIFLLKLIDQKIELNNKINRELENLAKDIYNYYFIQFDFLDINNNNKPYRSSGGEMVYNDILKIYIPKGWEVKDIKELCDIKDGYAFKTNDYISNGKYKIITIKNVLYDYVDSNKCDTIDFIPNNIDKYSTLKEKDILISLTGEIGRISLVYGNNLLLNQRVGNIIPKDNIYYSYILYLFKSVFIKDKLKQISNGSNQKNLSPIEAEKIKVLIPPKDILTNFSNLIKPKIDLIINNKKQNLQLSQLRDFLLPMLMNGQVEVEGKK